MMAAKLKENGQINFMTKTHAYLCGFYIGKKERMSEDKLRGISGQLMNYKCELLGQLQGSL